MRKLLLQPRPQPRPKPNPNAQKGFSLVELMVAFAISMVLVLGALYLYSGTRTSQQSLDQAAGANDVGLYLLHLVGRDVGNAGFYPSISAENGLPNVINRYINITAVPAYNHGIFGCEGAAFNRATGACDAPVAGAPDTLVVAYFTNDAFNGQSGHRLDCEGSDVATAAVNTGRIGAGSVALSPQLPLLIANHYTVQTGATATNNDTTSMRFDGRTVSTRSLLCKGLVSAANTAYRPIMSGLADFQLSFGVSGAAVPPAGAPVQFVNADAVAALGNLSVDGVVMEPWERVVAVRVCMVSRSFESGTASVTGPQQWRDCSGTLQTATDLSVRKTFTQVFTVRNHLNATY